MSSKEKVKHFMMLEFRNVRVELNVSQEKMSELLDISVRSYSDLENGKYMCSCNTLINYLVKCVDDPVSFFKRLAQVINDEQ